MKLQELKLFEEPIETRQAEELWDENESDSNTYITTTVYYIKPHPKSDDRFDVFYDENGTRKLYGTLKGEDVSASFAPVRPNQKPDAEGYLTYRSGDVYDAFKYNGEPVKVVLATGKDGKAGSTAKLNKGDYLLRLDDGNNFTYSVEPGAKFDNSYTKKV
jgi:hypothetical protein